jgi:hypothetical protein
MSANGFASLIAIFVAFFVSNRIAANSPQNASQHHKYKHTNFT